MVQIPQYQQQVGLDAPTRSGPQLDTRVDSSIGQGLSQLGGAISNVAAAIEQRNKQKAEFNARLGLNVFQENLEQKLEDAKRNAPPDGTGLHDGFMKTVFQPEATKYLTGITDPEIRERMTATVSTLLADTYSHRAANVEHEISGNHSLTNYDTLRDQQLRGISANPAEHEAYLKGIYATIDTLPDVSAAKKAELKRQAAEAAPGIIAEALKVQDPEAYRFYGGTRAPGDKNSMLPAETDRIGFLTRRLTPAVIGAESGGDPRAVSPAGAVGMMQVMPDTAVEIAKRLGDKQFLSLPRAQQIEALKDEDLNTRYGTTYLGMMVERYGGDVEAALIAYNAGPGNADKWLAAGRDYKALPKRAETEPYVQKIFGSMGAAKVIAGPATVPAATAGRRIPIATGTQPGRQPLKMDGIRPELLDRWELVQGDFGRALPIVSGKRDADTNAKAGGARQSQHMGGNAIDVDVSNMPKAERLRLIEMASARGFTGIGVYGNSLHFDMRPGAPVMWGPTHHADSVPPWAFTVGVKHRAGTFGGKAAAAGDRSSATPAIPGADTSASSGASGMVFVPPVLASMPFADFQKLQASVADTRAVMADRQRAELEMLKVSTLNQIDDDIASIGQTGKSAVQGSELPQLEQLITQAHGLDKLASYREDRFVAQRVFDLTQDAGRLPDQALQARLEALKPQGGEGAAVQQRVYDGVAARIKSVQEERSKDPALAAIRNFPEVEQAWASFSPEDPATAREAIRATITAQLVTGVPGDKVQPLPAQQASMVADVVRDETQPLDARINTVVATVLLTTDPTQQEQIIRQMVRAGLTPKIANVVDAWKRNDTGAARRLFQAAMLDPSKAPKLGANDNSLSAAVEEAILGADTIGQAFYGLDLGDPRAADVAASDLDLAKSSARIAMASGMDQDAAVTQAVSDIFGPVDVVNDALPSGGLVHGLVDTGTDKGVLLRGFDRAQGKMVDVLQGYLARAYGGLPANASPEMTAIYKAAHVNEMNRVLADGIWRNNGAGWSFYDPARQAFVSDDTGKPISFTTEDILKLGAGAPAKKVPEDPASMMAPAAPPQEVQPGIVTDPWGMDSTPAAPEPPAPGKQGALEMPGAPAPTVAGQLKSQRSDLIAAAKVRSNMPGVVA
jgi:soluble lytic murein transglycosylase-like protein